MGYLGKIVMPVIILTILMASVSNSSAEPLGEFEKSLMGKYANMQMEGADGWKLVKKKRGIKVSWRRVSVTTVKAFKAEMDLETDLSTLVAFFMDDENVPEWATHAEGSKVIKRFNEIRYYVYQRTKLTWPVKPRDSIVFRSWHQDPETLVVTAKAIAVPDYLPKKKGYVRIPLLATYFKITPIGDGKVNLVWETILDPSGWVPVWIVNLTITAAPYGTFCNIQDLMPIDKYKGETISWLKEPQKFKIDESGIRNRL